MHETSNRQKLVANSIGTCKTNFSTTSTLATHNDTATQAQLYKTLDHLSVYINELNDDTEGLSGNYYTRQGRSEVTTQELSAFEELVIPGKNASLHGMKHNSLILQRNFIDKPQRVKRLSLVSDYGTVKHKRTKKQENIGMLYENLFLHLISVLRIDVLL
jgi:hypothetical protein